VNYTVLILFAVFFVAVGFIVGLLIMRLRVTESTPGARPNQGQTGSSDPVPAPSPRVGALQFWKDTYSGTDYIELDGQVYQSVSDLSAEQQRFLAARAGDLLRWLKQVSPPAPAATRLPPAPAPEPSRQPPVAAPQRPFSRLMQPSVAKAPSQGVTLAEQVDEILQEKLSGSPAMAQRTIHLISLPNHDLVVEVDHRQYDSIDAVPDSDVRLLIKEAVAEWQRRTQGGRR